MSAPHTRIAKHPSASTGPKGPDRPHTCSRSGSNVVLSIGRQSTGDRTRCARSIDAHRRAAVLERPVHGEALLRSGHLRWFPPLLAFTRPAFASRARVCRHGYAASMCSSACFVSLAAPVSSAYTSGVTTSQPQAAGMRRKTAHNLAASPAAPIQHDLASVRTTTANPSFGLALGMPQARVRGTRSASTKPSNATCAARGARTASASPAGMGTTHDSAAASTS